MKIGVDLGTDSVLAWVPREGVVAKEPCILAMDASSGKLVASGNSACQMVGRVPGDIRLVHPIACGRVADPEAAVTLLSDVLRRALGWRMSLRPTLAVAVGDMPNSYASQALLEALKRARLGSAVLVPRAIAAARGAELAVQNPEGRAIVDLGAGSTEVSIMSMNQIIGSRCIQIGGQTLDEVIRAYVHSRHGLDISAATAQQIKHTLGCASADGAHGTLPVWGRNHPTGLPHQLELSADEIYEALREPLGRIAAGVQQALEQVPPGLAADLVDDGLVLTGGGALLRGLDRYLQQRLQLPVRVAEDPVACVAAGALLAIPEAPAKQKKRWSANRPVVAAGPKSEEPAAALAAGAR